MRRESVVFPYVRAAAMYPKRGRIPYCYEDPPANDLAKSVLAAFATAECFNICRFVRASGL